MMLFVYQEKESWASRGIKLYLKETDHKDKLVKSFEKNKFRREPAPINLTLKRICNIREEQMEGRSVWILKPKKKPSKKVIFFSHGGGHINNITRYHWKMVEYLIKKTHAKVIVPDYPLLPEANFLQTYEMIRKTYYHFVKNVKNSDLIFLGDSSGGAISLTLAEILRDENAPIQPSQLILISPELDASKIHPDVPNYAPYDVMLSPEIYNVIGDPYVAGTPRDNFMVSPGLGNLEGLGKISIFTGTYDILFPYSLDLRKRLEREHRDFNFFEYPRMIHVWTALTMLKEARFALDQMAELINS